jgi:hypothetical protein
LLFNRRGSLIAAASDAPEGRRPGAAAMSNIVGFRRPDRFENEADIEDIVALTDLLCVMMAQPDAETALVGMHCVMLIISDHAHALRERMYGRQP